MKEANPDPLLIVRVSGSAKNQGQISRQDLLKLGKNIQRALEEIFREYLRGQVSVKSEAKIDPVGGRIVEIQFQDLEPAIMEGEGFDTFGAETFWQEKSLEQLAAEQGINSIAPLEQVWGKGGDLWADDEDFSAFMEATAGAR